MRATDWEFRQRFWVYAAIFTAGYSLYRVDPLDVVAWLVRALGDDPRGPLDIPLGKFQLAFVGAAALAVLGAMLRTWAAAYLHSEVVHDRALHSDRLVADGPYRHLRNPLYVGLLLAGVGLAAMASRLGAVFMLVALTVFTLRLIGREEAALLASGGDSYRAFCAAVPRLVPALRPRLPAGGARASWGQAFLGETFFWALAAALAVFAATLRIEPFLWVIGAALVLRGALALLWWRRPAVDGS
jgi:protein-S-isoprenylcysteine O-methyltransferase Ste14